MYYQRFVHNGHTELTRRANGTGSIDPDGYIRIGADKEKAHVIVAERALGKPLPLGAIVQHVDEDRANNAPRNPVICPDHAYHMLLHRRMRALAACGHADWRICTFCKTYDDPAALAPVKSRVYHARCVNEYNRARRQRASQERAP